MLLILVPSHITGHSQPRALSSSVCGGRGLSSQTAHRPHQAGGRGQDGGGGDRLQVIPGLAGDQLLPLLHSHLDRQHLLTLHQRAGHEPHAAGGESGLQGGRAPGGGGRDQTLAGEGNQCDEELPRLAGPGYLACHLQGVCRDSENLFLVCREDGSDEDGGQYRQETGVFEYLTNLQETIRSPQ